MIVAEEPDDWVSELLRTAPGLPYVIFHDGESES